MLERAYARSNEIVTSRVVCVLELVADFSVKQKVDLHSSTMNANTVYEDSHLCRTFIAPVVYLREDLGYLMVALKGTTNRSFLHYFSGIAIRSALEIASSGKDSQIVDIARARLCEVPKKWEFASVTQVGCLLSL